MTREIEPGTRITQHVELVREIGSGAMGTVWEAKNLALGTPVAVKLISGETGGADAGLLERFQREASLMARIRSPHAVQVFDFGRLESGQPFIVMELLAGESLAARIARGPLSLEQVATVVAQTAEVLGRAHRLGVVHRDIKPDNLFLIDSGYDLFIKVLDFGVAKDVADEGRRLTQTGTLVGTPYYMSPELVTTARGATPMADLWALAVVAYEALTLAMPFDSETLGGVLVKIAAFDYLPPSRRAAHLGPEVDAWFARAFHRDVASRFSSAEEMAVHLSALVAAPARGSLASLPGSGSPGLVSVVSAAPGVVSAAPGVEQGSPSSAASSSASLATPSLPAPSQIQRVHVGTLAATVAEKLPGASRSSSTRTAIIAVAAAVVASAIGVLALRPGGAREGPAAAAEGRASRTVDERQASEAPPAATASPSQPVGPSVAPSATSSAPVAVSAKPPPPRASAPRPAPPRPASAPTKSDSCMAYDAARRRWVYTCQ
jgi:serine/threonine protein kinase